jgi:hypothetical protein
VRIGVYSLDLLTRTHIRFAEPAGILLVRRGVQRLTGGID